MIYRQYTNSHMVHATDAEGRTHEADNLDEAGPYKIITEEQFAEVPRSLQCRRCFPTFADPLPGPDDAGPDEAADSDIVGTTEGTY